ncbi:hypothetical protein [Nocardia wallacei]|uniref:hypothetical protein n=1 Tax=Nocardia wallacei TaxID=480035 RepID=UPI0024550003|nr:hypothetical protein [Nocardia wallacei]
MVEPISLSILGGALLTEGVKFLYGQASALVDRRRTKADRANEDAAALAAQPAAGVLSSAWNPQSPDSSVLNQVEPSARMLVTTLNPYVTGALKIDPHDPVLLSAVDALRKTLEYVFRNEITFTGEKRTVDRKRITGEVDVSEVVGYAAAIRMARDTNADLHGIARVDRVAEGGRLMGVDITDHDA